ncbi:MAG: M20/M25/M40 family metallo-hydrolase [Spirochaetales bacterium]|nr:M20/M25/M40 family metallo-hydrolase [Spirochaetales bacterium]
MSKEMMYAEKLSKMIQVETISERGVANKHKFDQFHVVLKELFPRVFAECEVVEIDSSLLIKMKGKSNGDPILFMSHQDVVSATGKWQHEPFSGDIADGAVWGRGTVDTKGALFCIFQAFEEALEDGYIPNVDVYIASSSTEEVAGDGAPKTVKYLQDHGVHLQFLIDEGGMILDEPMKGVKGRFAMIGTVEKGTGNVRFVAKSAGGHASAPGRNTPLVRLGKFMAEIEDKDPNKGKMNPTVIEMFKRFGPYTKGALGFVFRNAKVLSPLLSKVLPKINPVGGAMIKTTMAFTMAEGSKGLNVLPETAYVNANIRFIQHQGVKETMAILEPIAKKYDLEIEMLQCKEPQKAVDHTAAPFKLVESTVKEIYPDVVPSPYVMTGGTDAYYYYPVTDNAIRFAPLVINNQQYKSVHGLDENINIDALPKGVEFYKAIMKKV